MPGVLVCCGLPVRSVGLPSLESPLNLGRDTTYEMEWKDFAPRINPALGAVTYLDIQSAQNDGPYALHFRIEALIMGTLQVQE